MGSQKTLFLFIIIAIFVSSIFYILTLQRAVKKCKPYNRDVSPNTIWFILVPFVGFVWHFFVVKKLINTFRMEFLERNIEFISDRLEHIGILMCIMHVSILIPFFGILCGLVGIFLWVIFWLKVTNVSYELDRKKSFLDSIE